MRRFLLTPSLIPHLFTDRVDHVNSNLLLFRKLLLQVRATIHTPCPTFCNLLEPVYGRGCSTSSVRVTPIARLKSRPFEGLQHIVVGSILHAVRRTGSQSLSRCLHCPSRCCMPVWIIQPLFNSLRPWILRKKLETWIWKSGTELFHEESSLDLKAPLREHTISSPKRLHERLYQPLQRCTCFWNMFED